MSNQDNRTMRFERDLAAAMEALADQDYAKASAALEKCKRIDRNNPDVLGIDAALLTVAGEFDEALAVWDKVIAAEPAEAGPRLAAAEILLHEHAAFEDAIDYLEPAMELIDEHDDLLFAVALLTRARLGLATMALLDGDEREAERQRAHACEALAQVPAESLTEYADILDHATLARQAEDFARAQVLIAAAMAHPHVDEQAYLVAAELAAAQGDMVARRRHWQAASERLQRDADQLPPIDEAALRQQLPLALFDLAEDNPKFTADPGAVVFDYFPEVTPAMLDVGIDPVSLCHPKGGPSDCTGVSVFTNNVRRLVAEVGDLSEVVGLLIHELAAVWDIEAAPFDDGDDDESDDGPDGADEADDDNDRDEQHNN